MGTETFLENLTAMPSLPLKSQCLVFSLYINQDYPRWHEFGHFSTKNALPCPQTSSIIQGLLSHDVVFQTEFRPYVEFLAPKLQ